MNFLYELYFSQRLDRIKIRKESKFCLHGKVERSFHMQDPRIEKLAKQIVRYSLHLQPKERVLIETNGFEIPLTKAIIKEV